MSFAEYLGVEGYANRLEKRKVPYRTISIGPGFVNPFPDGIKNIISFDCITREPHCKNNEYHDNNDKATMKSNDCHRALTGKRQGHKFTFHWIMDYVNIDDGRCFRRYGYETSNDTYAPALSVPKHLIQRYWKMLARWISDETRQCGQSEERGETAKK